MLICCATEKKTPTTYKESRIYGTASAKWRNKGVKRKM